MHYIKSKSILSSKNGMNMYRGCTHGCIYCDSRSEIYNMDHKFEDVAVKQNALELLKKELIKRPKAMIGLGSMSDPYMPLEKHVRYTHEALKLILRYGFGFTCITKSNLVLRDLDLLKKINEKSKVVIQMTLTTADDDLCGILEPYVCRTSERVKVLKTLNKHNIPTVVWLSPILPYINDTEENISKLLDFCIKTNVYGIICLGMGMTLRRGNRSYFLENLNKSFPGLKERYVREFGDNYSIASPNNKKLMELFNKKTSENGILNDVDEIFEYLREFPQKSYQTKL